jgi:RND family efflux transporter MFP subunit
MKRTYTTLFASLAVLLTLGLSACGSQESPAPDEGTAPAVQLEQARWTEVAETYRYAGSVEGARKATLSTKVMGRITALPVEEGSPVRRGQALVRIQSQDVEAQQAQVEAQLRQARAAQANAATNYERMETLFAAESATKKEFEDATLAYESAQEQVNTLQARLREVQDALGYTVVRAPFDGYVVRKQAEVGSLAVPGQPLVTVEDVERLEVVAQVPESEVGRIAVGDTVDVAIGAAGEALLRGRVVQVNPSAAVGSRQFEAHVRLLTARGVKPGMYATVVLRKGTRRVLTVPEAALVRRGQLTGLFTINHQNEALLRWVRTGRRIDGRVEVLSGLTDGERYVADLTVPLRDGQAVVVAASAP